MKLYVRLEAPFEWVRIGGKGVEAFGEVASPTDYPLAEEEEIVGVIPGEWVTTHLVDIPAKNRKQFNTAVPFALEDAVSVDIEQLYFSCPNWRPGAANIVYVVSKQKMSYWQSLANDAGLPLDRLVPDYSLLPFHDAAEYTLVQLESNSPHQATVLAYSENGHGVSIDDEFIDIWLQEVPMAATIAVNNEELLKKLLSAHPDRDFRLWQIGSKMAHWLEQPPQFMFDLMGEDYRPSVRQFDWRSFKMPIAVIALAVVMASLFAIYRYVSLHAEIKRIDNEAQEILQDSFPDLGSIEPGNERYMMEQALVRRGGTARAIGVPEMLANVALVLSRQNVTLVEVVYRDDAMLITCRLNDFAQVDVIRKQLNARPKLGAQLDSSSAEDGQIIATYTLTKN